MFICQAAEHAHPRHADPAPPSAPVPKHFQLLPELAPWAGGTLPRACCSLQWELGPSQLLCTAAECPPCYEPPRPPAAPGVHREQLGAGSRPNTAGVQEGVEGWAGGHTGTPPPVPAHGTPLGLSPAAGPTGSSHS